MLQDGIMPIREVSTGEVEFDDLQITSRDISLGSDDMMEVGGPLQRMTLMACAAKWQTGPLFPRRCALEGPQVSAQATRGTCTVRTRTGLAAVAAQRQRRAAQSVPEAAQP